MPRQPLISRSAAVAEALRTLDEEGAGALSMRRVAQRVVTGGTGRRAAAPPRRRVEHDPATRALLLVESYALGAALTSVSAGFADESVLDGRPALSAALAESHPRLRLGAEDFEHGPAMLRDGIAGELSSAAAESAGSSRE